MNLRRFTVKPGKTYKSRLILPFSSFSLCAYFVVTLNIFCFMHVVSLRTQFASIRHRHQRIDTVIYESIVKSKINLQEVLAKIRSLVGLTSGITPQTKQTKTNKYNINYQRIQV